MGQRLPGGWLVGNGGGVGVGVVTAQKLELLPWRSEAGGQGGNTNSETKERGKT